jgi:hypothetical protein
MGVKEPVVLSLPIEGQMTVVNSMILPLLKRSGIAVKVTPTRSGMRLDLEFKAAEVSGADDDSAKSVGTDSPDQAAALWELKARVEAAQAAHAAQHRGDE